jgi:DNA-binding response OmpR family regulator
MQSTISAPVGAGAVLVIAACPILVKSLSRILLCAGYNFDVISEVASRSLIGVALAILVSSEPYWRIEYIYEICLAMKSRAPDLPIMVLGRDDVDIKVKLFASGADDYVLERFDTEEFLARVRAHIRRRKNH